MHFVHDEVAVVESRVRRVAEAISDAPDAEALDFHGYTGADGRYVPQPELYPPIGHPGALEMFFFACAHQYGFWTGSEQGYEKPLVGRVDGTSRKGSDLLWALCTRALLRDERTFAPARLATADDAFYERLFSDDEGLVPFPAWRERIALSRKYGASLRHGGRAPADLVHAANRDHDPIGTLVWSLRQHAGYDGDPLVKKAMLLALVLAKRPERFLREPDGAKWAPIVDYHVMRVALRTGMVRLEGETRQRNAARQWASEEDESAIRRASYAVVSSLVTRSRRPLAVVDHVLWSARRYCPETTTPDCERCPLKKGCARQIDLFQPVFRTTAY